MNEILPPDNALAVITEQNAVTFFAEKGLDPILDKIRQEVKNFKGDISSEIGRKEIASFAYRLAKMKTQTDKLGKDLVSGIKAQAKIIDAERARAWDEIEAMQTEVRKPLTEWEKKEERRVTVHKAELATIEGLTLFATDPTVAEVEKRIEQFNAGEGRAWEEFAEVARATRERVGSALADKLVVLKKREADALELARLQKAEADRLQKERDDKIAAEAADKVRREAEEKAKADAERHAREKREADERAEREKNARIAAENKAAAEQKAAREKHERDKELAVQAERDRAAKVKADEEAAAAKREANKKHRAKINNAALDAIKAILVSNGIVDAQAGDLSKLLVTEIASNGIPHVTIAY